MVTLVQGIPASLAGQIGFMIWVLALFTLWGWGLAQLYLVTFPAAAAGRGGTGTVSVVASEAPRNETASATSGEAEDRATDPDADARVISRRRFITEQRTILPLEP